MIKINIFAVSPHGTRYLATRAHARNTRHALEHHTATTPDGHDIAIDLTDVHAMTYPYADELLGNYYASTATQTPATTAILLTGLNDDTRETIDLCLRLRSLLAAENNNGHLQLLGAPQHLQDTYKHAAELGAFRASTLADRLGLSLSNVNNRLKRLAAGRALRCLGNFSPARGGREFIYSTSGCDEK